MKSSQDSSQIPSTNAKLSKMKKKVKIWEWVWERVWERIEVEVEIDTGRGKSEKTVSAR